MRCKKRVVKALLGSLLFLSTVQTIASICYKYKKPLRRIRRFGVRPMNRLRHKEGFFARTVQDMRNKEWDPEQFFKLTRMTPKLFDFLLKLVGPYLQKDKLNRRSKKLVLSPEQRLIMTLHYLAHGSSMQQMAWFYLVGKTTVHCIIKETCQVLWKVLAPSQLPEPKKEDWLRISKEFFLRWNLPNCFGAVDGKHINIKAPNNSGSEFFNYKKTFSVVLMATCDAYYRFTSIDIGAAGGNHDCPIFKNSGFGNNLINSTLDIPEPAFLPKTKTSFPHFIAADAAFPLHTNIMRPYPGKNLGEIKNIFNYRLSRGRRTIENSFGILAQRWRILLKTLETSVEMTEAIVKATVILHNFLQNSELDLPPNERKYCPTGFSDCLDQNGVICDGQWRNSSDKLRSVQRVGTNNFRRSVGQQRDLLASYFVSPEGSLPWQENYVFRGGAPGL